LSEGEKDYLKAVNDFKPHFETAMDDDFNTPQAVSFVFDFVNKSNKFFEDTDSPNEGLCNFALNTLLKLGNILTLFQSKKSGDDASLEKVRKIVVKYGKKADGKNLEELIDLLLEIREEARNNKDWNTADGIRKDLDSIGFEIQDTDSGPVWRKK